MIEKDLKIYDVWESTNGNLFIKMTDEYSIAIGAKGEHEPNDDAGELKSTQYVKSNDVSTVKKVGRIKFDEPEPTEKITDFTIGTKVRWFYRESPRKSINQIVYIASEVIGGNLVRVDRKKKNGNIKEGGYIRIDELYVCK